VVNNTNLGPQTSAETVLSSMPYVDAIANALGLPVKFTCCPASLEPELRGKIESLFPLDIQKIYYQLDAST
jgi:hypothetical protein